MAALEKAMELNDRGGPQNWLPARHDYLATCTNSNRPRSWYAKAAAWLENNPMTDELYHFRKEASDMMGIHWP